MTVKLQHPDSPDPIEVGEADADKYKASGWTEVTTDVEPQNKPKVDKK